MAGQGSQITTGMKIAIAVISLILATGYFTFLDWGAMKIQGLDYFYMFRK
ncbi:MAG TPA: hypothetical protein VE201_03310 [Nitrospirales bacterium]|jgi:hypothetical protein|nr:hypothetical protein [Nitrospirales bacterium]